MEVFLTNVPRHLTDRTLEKELRPHMNALGILDWACSTKNKNNKGWVTFLNAEDGKRFLKRHGKEILPDVGATFKPTPKGGKPPKDRARANLLLMNTHVWVAPSNRPPDPFMLKSLTHRLEEKHRQRTQQDAPSTDDAIVFQVSHLACGHNTFQPDKTLTFNEQCRLSQRGLAKFGKRMIILKFEQGVKVEIPHSSIVEMIHTSVPSTFTLILSEPPRFYHTKSDLEEQMERLGLIDDSKRPQGKPITRSLGLSSSKEHSKCAGTCLVYQLGIFGPDFDHNMISLKKKEIMVIAHSKVTLNQMPIFYGVDYHTEWAKFYDGLVKAGSAKALPFGILFQLQSLVFNNFLHPRSAHTMLVSLEKMFQRAKLDGKPEPVSQQAFKILHGTGQDGISYPCHNTDPSELDPKEILKFLLSIEKRLQSETNMEFRDVLLEPEITDHHAWVFKATVTPTRITLHGPDLEPLNRILRKYPNQTDYFMRVTFADEDGSDLFFSGKVSYDKIFDRYKSILSKGLEVAGRVYGFLGFSHSSLRSHSAWFSAPFFDDWNKLQIYGNIIKSLGDFDKIQIPAKCAARIGQAFSETPSFISISKADIKRYYIPDVKSMEGETERVFSDGVGTISREALELIWPRLPRGSLISTCLQIRWGGVKGMLSLDSRLQGRAVCIRKESMEKFPSKDWENLEICDVASRPLKLVLNRQLIKIMEDLGVSKQWFLRLQKMELDRLRAVTADAYNTATFLHLQSIGTSFFLPNFVKSLDKYGIDYRQDRFLRAVVESVVLRELRLLKHKARIPVPKGVTLFGIMDETRFLKEGEVYVCFDTYRRPGKPAIVEDIKDGTFILVTRSPALHPGDIQEVMVRTEDQLRQALEDISNGKSQKRASLEYGIPRSTLQLRLQGGQTRKVAFADWQRLSPDQESKLAQWVRIQASLGLAPTHQQVKEFAERVLAAAGDTKPLGKGWIYAFVRRNPIIKVQRSRSIDSRRVNGASTEVIRNWFNFLAIPEIKDIKPANRYNMDETGILEGQGANGLVLGMAETTSVRKKQPGSRAWVSIIECISALGRALRPLIIFKGKTVQQQWFPLHLVPYDGWEFTATDNGWTTDLTAIEWLEKVFIPQTMPEAEGEARLLIVDGHGSHTTTDFMWNCYINNIHLLFLPPHSSHVLQPLDQSVFSPVKSAYRKELGYLSQWNDSTIIGKRNFLDCYQKARLAGLSVSNIRSGWKWTGLHPVAMVKPLMNPMVLPEPSAKPTTPKPTSRGKKRCHNGQQTTPVEPWDSASSAVVWSTPRKLAELSGQLHLYTQLDNDTSTQRLLFRKVKKGFTEQAWQLAAAQQQLAHLRAQVTNAAVRKRKTVQIDPNTKFANIRDIHRAQIEAGEKEVITAESSDSECPSEAGSCIVVGVVEDQ